MRKIGIFELDREFFNKAINSEISFTDLSEILSKFLIVRAEWLIVNDSIEYHAYSELFDEIEEGMLAPRYYLQIEQTVKDNEISLKLLGVSKI